MAENTKKPSPVIISIVNQKGGVGKTTTTINLGAALAELGLNVLLIDLDPQGNASTGLGIDYSKRVNTTYDLLVGDAYMNDVIQSTNIANLSIVPANTDLSSADIELTKSEKRISLLKDALQSSSDRQHNFDVILIDCPPSLNILTVNALVASHNVIVPLQSEFFALEGLSQLMLTIREIREQANPALRIQGIVLTMYDARNNLSQQVEQDARENLGALVYDTVIPRNVRLSEAPSFGEPVLTYDTNSKGSVAYRNLAIEVYERIKKKVGTDDNR